uniref:MAP kinase kinase n=1 Tax=Rhizophora mucronata TaxID=61149 RepID=A0A2P2LQ69_RHIMU
MATEFSRPALMPKSVIFGSPLRLTSKFAGFMSLCTKCLTPCK